MNAMPSALPGIRSAGKTGTTQAYRDAWYVGFTGNYTAAVWLGNDDFTVSNEMTGGSLPAMTWQRMMANIHRNIELKPIPGIEHPFVDPEVAEQALKEQQEQLAGDPGLLGPVRPPVLTAETTRTLRALADMFATAPALEARPEPETLSVL